ncbi:MAG TPA: Lrp/AsnC family transcriptional regulator, partial [Methanomicrobiales archaeon]|nr:Lrp/AsnC family transcriptional regulator [Methanomicrobiales archaeon]
RDLAERCGIPEEELFTCLEDLKRAGVVRRFGARINQRRIGFTVNAMIGWKVPEERIAEVGRLMGDYPEVTHCYERRTVPGRWEYNLFTVLHERDKESLDSHIDALSRLTGIQDYVVLVSGREFKRSPAGRIPTNQAEGRRG